MSYRSNLPPEAHNALESSEEKAEPSELLKKLNEFRRCFGYVPRLLKFSEEELLREQRIALRDIIVEASALGISLDADVKKKDPGELLRKVSGLRRCFGPVPKMLKYSPEELLHEQRIALRDIIVEASALGIDVFTIPDE